MAVNVILIEDDAVDELYPFALTQNSWQLRAGRYSVVERWQVSLPDARVVVHSHRTSHQRLFEESYANPPLETAHPLVVVISTAFVAPETMRLLAQRAQLTARPCVISNGTATIGVILPQTPGRIDEIIATIDSVPADDVDLVVISCHIIRRLWDVLDLVDVAVRWDADLTSHRVAQSATIHPTAVIDESKGPVLIDEAAEIGALAVVQGPCSIGAHGVVKPLSHVTHSIIGPYCKVGGEVSVSIFHGYSNKQHYGFLGHSVIGEWVNLGAGTTTSNLKNTYHDVRPVMPWGRESSGRLFLGSLIGDFTRTAIGTLLPTGGVYGACSHIMASGLAASHVRSFVWSDGVEYERDRAFQTCDIMMRRRGRELTASYQTVLDEVRSGDV